jgi:hypothetical protein
MMLYTVGWHGCMVLGNDGMGYGSFLRNESEE